MGSELARQASFLECPCWRDCARYVLNAATCHSDCCGASCDCETREIEVLSDTESEYNVEITKVRNK
jgi:hypothetical protein